jgi:ppGpp synthetase/RelA/SpoT-type nucleotidyltranferase
MIKENQENIKTKILDEYKKNKIKYDYFTKQMRLLIEQILAAKDVKVKAITSRSKDISSLDDKITRKDYKYEDLHDITDLCGIRIITYYDDDVYKIEEIIKNNFKVDIENSIDKIKSLGFDRFGYMSLHYVVQLNDTRGNLEEYANYKNIKFEIQIRSVLQDAWAEIEHELSYKTGIMLPPDIKRTFSRLSSLLETADISFRNLRDKINSYTEIAIEEIDKEKDVELNDITLSVFLKSNFYTNYLKIFKTKLEEQLNKDIEIIASSLMSSYTKRFKYNSVNTIKEIEKYLNEYLEEILLFGKHIHEGDTGDKISISSNWPLFALNYALLVNNGEEQNLYNNVVKYFKDTDISWGENRITKQDKEIWVENLRRVFLKKDSVQ